MIKQKRPIGSQVLNFLWLNLDLPARPDPADGSIRQPLPEEYIQNIRKAGSAHPAAEIDLWVDSKRLTERQMAYLQHAVEEGLPNVHVKDLRTIEAYDREKLYNQPEKNPSWRDSYFSKIWLQVDAAKILVSLQGDFDQSFFADMDHYHLNIGSAKVQNMLEKHGLLIGSSSASYINIENQLWGFERSRRKFFEEYYAEALKEAHKGINGYSCLCIKARKELEVGEGIPIKEYCLPIGSRGLAHAVQPGHEMSGIGSWVDSGWWNHKEKKAQKKPAVISAQQLSQIFGTAAEDVVPPDTAAHLAAKRSSVPASKLNPA